MPNVFDVAAYILKKKGAISALRLQKLVYYAQAWSLVWDDEPLFLSRIEAWVSGPVSPSLYAAHKGQFKVTPEMIAGNSSVLSGSQRETIEGVLKFYGNKPTQWLVDLTHSERPWLDARKGLSPQERGNRIITHEAMAEYYGSLSRR
jgi:uncharacterized phage-associated protein